MPASVVASTPIHPRADRPAIGVTVKQALHEAVRRGTGVWQRACALGMLHPPAPGLARVLRVLGVTPQRLADLVAVEMASRR